MLNAIAYSASSNLWVLAFAIVYFRVISTLLCLPAGSEIILVTVKALP